MGAIYILVRQTRAPLLETVKSGTVDMKLIDNSVYRLLMENSELGLFETLLMLMRMLQKRL